VRGLVLAGLVALGTLLVNVLFAGSLAGTSSLLARQHGTMSNEVGGIFFWAAIGIGVTQLVWVLPAIVLTRKRAWLAGGIAIGAALTLLLNGACFGALCGGYLK
jgi:hypothetical protein